MKLFLRRLVTVALLAFVASALATQLIRSFQPRNALDLPDGKRLLLFHAQSRCATCLHLEKTIEKILLPSDTQEKIIEWMTIAYDVPENSDLAERFSVGTIAVILVDQKDGQLLRQRNLSQELWPIINDDDAVTQLLSNAVAEFLDE